MPNATGRTVFILGKKAHGNRQVVIVEDGEEYSLDPATIQPYTTSPQARFPYDLAA